jgi:phosphosulfolactate synthase (CoM biosynthesis protein A)
MSFIEALNNVMAIQERYLYREKSRDTSIEAARSVMPHMSETHERVLSYAFDCGYSGFTDVEMANHFNCLTSHYRSRRAQLTEAGYIVATEVRRRHPERGNNRDHIVWKHKDFIND